MLELVDTLIVYFYVSFNLSLSLSVCPSVK